MSLLQRALDRAENQETPVPVNPPSVPAVPPKSALLPKQEEKPKGTAVSDEAPRLKSIRYYEKENRAVEEAIQKEIKKEASKNLPHEVILEQEEKKKAQKNFLFLILALLTVSLLAWKLIPPSPETAQSPALESAAVSEKASPVVVKTQTPVTARPISQTKFFLTGITASGDTSLAVINNQVVGAGDQLREGARVKAITASRVVLEMDGRQIVLDF